MRPWPTNPEVVAPSNRDSSVHPSRQPFIPFHPYQRRRRSDTDIFGWSRPRSPHRMPICSEMNVLFRWTRARPCSQKDFKQMHHSHLLEPFGELFGMYSTTMLCKIKRTTVVRRTNAFFYSCDTPLLSITLASRPLAPWTITQSLTVLIFATTNITPSAVYYFPSGQTELCACWCDYKRTETDWPWMPEIKPRKVECGYFGHWLQVSRAACKSHHPHVGRTVWCDHRHVKYFRNGQETPTNPARSQLRSPKGKRIALGRQQQPRASSQPALCISCESGALSLSI